MVEHLLNRPIDRLLREQLMRRGVMRIGVTGSGVMRIGVNEDWRKVHEGSREQLLHVKRGVKGIP